jgi:probable O-glycosylation ligase (exosortase A-associated)
VYISIGLTLFVLAMLPICLGRPWIGVLMWCWLGYMNPHRLTWSFTYAMPFAMMVAIPTLAGLLVAKDRRPIPWTRETYLLATLWGLFVLTTVFAMDQEYAWDYLFKVSKILLFVFVTLMLFQDRGRLRKLLLVIALSIGFFGLKGGIWAIATGGANRVMMPEDSMLGGSNGAGLALNIALPMLLYLAREEKNVWLRRLLQVTFLFSVPAVLFTYSRGALLGLAAVVLVMASKAKRFLVASLGLVILYVSLVNFAPPEWFEKMGTIRNYEEDGSALARLDAWYIAFRLALDHPLFGGGFGSVGMTEVVQRYMPNRTFNVNSHSIFFNVMGEHGFTGLILFLALIGSSLLTLRRLRRRTSAESAQWVHSYSHMMEAAFVGYLVTGAFLSAAYIDLFYQLIGLVILLRVLAAREGAKEPEATVVPAAAQGHRPGYVWAGGSRWGIGLPGGR